MRTYALAELSGLATRGDHGTAGEQPPQPHLYGSDLGGIAPSDYPMFEFPASGEEPHQPTDRRPSGAIIIRRVKEVRLMVSVQRTKRVAAGDWQTLESGWNATFDCQFVAPVGAQVKIRYGTGWIFGRDSQRQTLDGINTKTLRGRRLTPRCRA
jgi:hypothetical protein